MSPQPRVLSLLSASTEIIHRLGCSHLLVGRSHGCDDPPLATTLPIATAPRVDPNAGSRELDEAVRAQSVSGGPIYHIHSKLVSELRPDVIVTQEQCRICAVTPEDVSAACADWPCAKLVTIKPTTLDDVLGDMITISAALGVPGRGQRLVSMMRARLASLAAIAREVTTTPPRVVHVEWLAPLMGSGYWIAECMEAANCTMLHGSRGGHSQTLESLAALREADVILLAPCGFSIERTHAELASLKLLDNAEWQALPAVRRGSVAVADGNLYFNRSSCGILHTAEIVAEIAHTELAGLFGHHGRHWVSLEELAAFCRREGAASPTKVVQVAPSTAGSLAKRAKVDPSLDNAAECQGASRPAQHVGKQVELLRAREFAKAFAMNSAANRSRIGSAQKFEALVISNSSFAALTDANNALHWAEDACGGAEGRHTIKVRLQTDASELVFAFDVSEGSAEGDCATEGVRIIC